MSTRVTKVLPWSRAVEGPSILTREWLPWPKEGETRV